MTRENRRAPRILTIAIATAGTHLFLLTLFRSYLPLGAIGRSFTAGAVLLFVLVAMRVRADTGSLRRPFLLLFACFLGVFVALEDYGGRIGNDGTMIFVSLRSLVMDGDLDLTNEFEAFVPSKFSPTLAAAEAAGQAPVAEQELGPIVFWLPFYLAAHLLVGLWNLFGAGIEANGYTYPYINSVCLASLLWAFFGVWLSYTMTKAHFGEWPAAWGAVALWLGSPLLWYTVFEPSMSHAVATAAVALFLWLWLRARETRELKWWAATAAAAGLMVSVQRYNIYFLFAPVLPLLSEVRRLEREHLVRYAKMGGVLALALLAASSPFWASNLARHGSFLRPGDRLSSALLNWNDPAWSELLFSSKHGLFASTPLAYLAVIGLVLAVFRGKKLALPYLVTFLFGVYLLSSTWDWWGGASFGNRRMTEAYPILLFGLVPMLQLLVASPRALAAGAVSALVIWNLLLAEQKRRGEIPDMETFSYADAASRGIRRVYETLGHPSSAPASWMFARRYGVSPDRFDLVWGHRAYNNLTLDVGMRQDEHFLGRGWSQPARGPSGDRFRWGLGDESSWLVNLFEPNVYRLILEGEPARHPEGAPQSVEVLMNGERAGLTPWRPGETTVSVVLPKQSVRPGLNEIVLRYAYSVRADEVYGGEDPRRLAIRLSRLSLVIVK